MIKNHKNNPWLKAFPSSAAFQTLFLVFCWLEESRPDCLISSRWDDGATIIPLPQTPDSQYLFSKILREIWGSSSTTDVSWNIRSGLFHAVSGSSLLGSGPHTETFIISILFILRYWKKFYFGKPPESVLIWDWVMFSLVFYMVFHIKKNNAANHNF